MVITVNLFYTNNTISVRSSEGLKLFCQGNCETGFVVLENCFAFYTVRDHKIQPILSAFTKLGTKISDAVSNYMSLNNTYVWKQYKMVRTVFKLNARIVDSEKVWMRVKVNASCSHAHVRICFVSYVRQSMTLSEKR